MEPDTILQVASVSKFVTAVATMKLVEKGVLDLDKDVNDYLTAWKVRGLSPNIPSFCDYSVPH